MEPIIVSKLPTSSSLYGVSVSVPPDAIGNRGEKYDEGIPSTYETALVGPDDKLMYDEKAGYDDVCRHYSPRDVLKELHRLATYSGAESESKTE